MDTADLSRLGVTISPEIQADMDSLEAARAEVNAADGNIEQLSPTLQELHRVAPDNLDFGDYAYEMLGLLTPLVEAFDKRDWPGYLATHHKHLRTPAFLWLDYKVSLEHVEYWQLLKSVYIDDDHVFVNAELYRDLYKADVPGGPRSGMNESELEVFDALPDTVTIYRGAAPERWRGFSWSLERSVAGFFSKRTSGYVFTADVPRAAILAYYDERSEAEVLVELDALPKKAKISR